MKCFKDFILLTFHQTSNFHYLYKLLSLEAGIQYKPFVDYKTDIASDKLPLPSDAYWYTLGDVLTQYEGHSDNKFD